MKKLMTMLMAVVLIFTAGFTLMPAADVKAAEKPVAASIVRTESDLDDSKIKLYNFNIPNDEEKTIIVPLKAGKKGVLAYSFIAEKKDYPAVMTIQLCQDAAGTKSLQKRSLDLQEKDTIADSVTLTKAGTYYFKISVETEAAAEEEASFNVAFDSYIVNGEGAELKNKQQQLGAAADTKPIYYKITVAKPSIIEVGTNFAAGTWECSVTLCNGAKKAVSPKCNVLNDRTAVFAANKGTYYIKIQTEKDKLFSVVANIKPVNEKSGTAKKNAAALKAGAKQIIGLSMVSEAANKADWYKFTTTSTKQVNVYFKGSPSLGGKIILEFFDSKGASFGKRELTRVDADASFNPYVTSGYTTNKKLPKGTYYIKITKDKNSTSGYYNLGFK